MLVNEYADLRRKKICIVATIPFSINVFMRAHIKVLKEDYDVTLVANGRAEDLAGLLDERVSFIPLKIERKISFKKDILALVRLWELFRQKRFDSIHSITPKAGLLSMLAGRFAGVPLRFHTFTGQVWATKNGLYRFMLKSFDRVLAMNATSILADSHSQRLFLIKNQVVKASDIGVLADGSFAGVDLNRFKCNEKVRNNIRQSFNISDDAIVFLYLGRLNREKGLMDLSCAFAAVAAQHAHSHLLIVGPDEEGIEAEFSALSLQFPGKVHRAGFALQPEHYMAAADVFCLPSYREGFGSVLIEAASVGLPAIASRIYGITDAVDDNVTGILHHPAAVGAIVEAMLLLASNENLRLRMGNAARERVINKFSEERITKEFSQFYADKFSVARTDSKSIDFV